MRTKSHLAICKEPVSMTKLLQVSKYSKTAISLRTVAGGLFAHTRAHLSRPFPLNMNGVAEELCLVFLPTVFHHKQREAESENLDRLSALVAASYNCN